MNIGILIEESIRGYHHSNKRGLIPHPTTITRLYLLAGVKGMWEEEEKCPRVSPLTLTGVTRGPKGKRQKEIMEVDAEAETVLAEENETREMEAIPEDIHPAVAEEAHFRMSPLSHSYLEVQEHLPSQAEGSRSRGDSIEIMEMLRSMKREMEEREQKWERHQKIREDFLEAVARKKLQMWEQNWKLREEEWKKELQRREEKLLGKMNAKMEAFYNNQFKRDADLLNILKKKEAENKANMLRKIEGFKYLYREQFKEFVKLMKDRDQQLEDNDEYRRKIWLESLDLIDQNLSKLLECISELEGAVNQVGKKQDTLINAVQLNSEIYAKGKEIPSEFERQKSEMKFPKFDPSMTSFDVDPLNTIPPKSYKRRKGT